MDYRHQHLLRATYESLTDCVFKNMCLSDVFSFFNPLLVGGLHGFHNVILLPLCVVPANVNVCSKYMESISYMVNTR